MITTKMAVAFLNSIDCNCSPTDEDATEVMQWLALIYPHLGEEGMKGHNDIPIVAEFLKNPRQAGLEAILSELDEYYCTRVGHKIKPGIQVAALDGGVYYASIQVFPTNIASRSIIAKATEPTAMLAIQKAYDVWKINAKALEDAAAEKRRMEAVAAETRQTTTP